MYYKAIMDSLIDSLETQIVNCKSEIHSLPKGTLIYRRRGDNTFYFQRLKAYGYRKNEQRKGITKDLETIDGLARKQLLTVELSKYEGNLSLLKETSDRYEPIDAMQLIMDMKGAYATLKPECFFPPAPGGTTPEGRAFLESALIHMTPQGVRVRSKSELVIAGRLEHFDLGYEYETVLDFDGRIKRPDFKITRPRDGRTIYWEHAGLMTEPEYMEKHQQTLKIYAQNDIVPWDNLIVTYDDSNGGLDVKLVDAMIKGWLL